MRGNSGDTILYMGTQVRWTFHKKIREGEAPAEPLAGTVRQETDPPRERGHPVSIPTVPSGKVIS
jgi:hypothetical protein